MVFSFYYTEQISLIVLNKNPLMITINEEANNYNITSVNALIEGDYIIPGINGLEVNARESFYKMQEIDVFNKYFLVFNQVKPNISLEDNKNKIIKMGNKNLNKVSFILEKENDLSNYLKNNNIKASLLVDIDSYKKDSYFEVINNEVNGFKALENNLNLNKNNKHICVLNNGNKDICLKNKNYLIEPTIILNANNFIDIKNKIDKGSIILIKENVSLTYLKMLIKEINYKGLDIVYLSEIISEKNDSY